MNAVKPPGVSRLKMRRTKIDDQIAQARRRIFPFHILAERVTVGAAQILAAQIRRIPQNAVKSAPLNDLGKLQKPVEEALALAPSPRPPPSPAPAG